MFICWMSSGFLQCVLTRMAVPDNFSLLGAKSEGSWCGLFFCCRTKWCTVGSHGWFGTRSWSSWHWWNVGHLGPSICPLVLSLVGISLSLFVCQNIIPCIIRWASSFYVFQLSWSLLCLTMHCLCWVHRASYFLNIKQLPSLSFNFSILSDIFCLLSCMSSFFDMVESSGKKNCASLPIGEVFLICEMEGFILACQTCFWMVPQ